METRSRKLIAKVVDKNSDELEDLFNSEELNELKNVNENNSDDEDSSPLKRKKNFYLEDESPELIVRKKYTKKKNRFISQENEEIIISSSVPEISKKLNFDDSKMMDYNRIDIFVSSKIEFITELKLKSIENYIKNIADKMVIILQRINNEYSTLKNLKHQILYVGSIKKWILYWDRHKSNLQLMYPTSKTLISKKIHDTILQLHDCFRSLWLFCSNNELILQNEPILHFVNQISWMECDISIETSFLFGTENQKLINLEKKLLEGFSLVIGNNHYS